MKFVALLLIAAATAAHGSQKAAAARDRTVTEVVKLLQGMLEKSQADGDTERNLYAKYKCYCDTNEASKNDEIKQLTQEIAILQADIEETQAATGLLSQEVAKLDADMSANKQSRREADALRTKEKEAFEAKEKDLDAAIKQMRGAIKELAEIGADQTLSSAADHAQYMAGYDESLVALKSSVQQALLAASSFVSKKSANKVNAFLQAPFTGAYSSQSGEVVGILKSMKDTFEADLVDARAAEAKAGAAHDAYMKIMKKEHDTMEGSYFGKQGTLGSNDGNLGTYKEQLEGATKQKGEAEDFLAKLLDICESKKKQYDQRVVLRRTEEAAVSEAISILDSDDAFATFGTVDATKSGPTSFAQKRSVRRHSAGRRQAAASPPLASKAFLQRGAASAAGVKSAALARVSAMLAAHNPFDTVLKEIKKMVALIDEEEKADDKKKTWCVKERKESTDTIKDKSSEITSLEGDITGLITAIKDPETGLEPSIANDEASLQQNFEDQTDQTADRKEENAEYQKNIANLVASEDLLQKATRVLKKYYSQIELVQVRNGRGRRDDPAPPATWDDKYTGQSAAGGTDAISMLEFIVENTKKEETAAHDAEVSAQHSYEDSMGDLKKEEASLQENLAKMQESLAEKQELLEGKKKELKTTTKEKEAVEAYLVEIKPGCDFIMENIDARKTNRVAEKKGLGDAAKHLKGSAAYQNAEAAQHDEDLGDCLGICKKSPSEEHVHCKACLAKTSVPGYCAGHPDTEGC